MHINSNAADHLKIMMHTISAQKVATKQITSENVKMRQRVNALERTNQAQVRQIDTLQSMVSGLQRDRDELDSKNHELEQRVNELEENNEYLMRRENQLTFNVSAVQHQITCFISRYWRRGGHRGRGW